jgi:hypothetical protein
MRIFFSLIFFFNFFSESLAQQKKFWIYLSDKCVENMDYSNFLDLPLCDYYLDSLQRYGIHVTYQSKWLNAFSTELDESSFSGIENISFVTKVEPVQELISTALVGDSEYFQKIYSFALDQIGVEALSRQKLTGKGIKIGILDAGFIYANNAPELKHLFENSQIKESRDYLIKGNKDLFSKDVPNNDSHGTEVLTMVAGYNVKENSQFGFAVDAEFYLARTEHPKLEFRGEEDYWIAALEWMESKGIRLINTSLGYSTGFDKTEDNYKPEQMDGKTAAITKAAQIAAEEKNMLIIVAAGNEGSDPKWKIIAAPADAQGVLSVGATTFKNRFKMPYSSEGPHFLSYLKPNVSCFAAAGTSFSAPVITGLAACVMQKAPSLSNKEIIRAIEKSSHLYPYGNNFIGYGVPDADRLMQILDNPDIIFNRTRKINSKKSKVLLNVSEMGAESASVFNKFNEHVVVKQFSLKAKGGKFIIKRVKDVKFTTIVTKEKVVEIAWD